MALVNVRANELDAFPDGTVISVIQEGGGYTHYTREDGRWKAEGLPGLRSGALANPAAAQKVGVEKDIPIGDWLVDDYNAVYYKLLYKRHGTEVFAKVRQERLLEVTTDAIGYHRSNESEPMPRAWENAALQGMNQAAKPDAQARLDQILASGVVPKPTDKTVSVQVWGKMNVQPTEEQAKAMINDEATIVSVTTSDVEWSKVFELVRSSPWDCVCDEITQADIDALKVPSPVTRWSVLDCA